MRPRRPIPALLLALAVAGAAGPAHAQTAASPLPLGTDGHGVRLVERGRPAHLVVLLSPKRYREVAGHQLPMVCAPVPTVTLGGGVVTGARHDVHDPPRPPGGVGAVLHPPRRRGPLVTRLSPHWDWCALSLRKVRGNRSRETGFATIPLTPAGAAFADERRAALRVIVGELLLSTAPTRINRVARLLHATVLGSPAQTPVPGRLGLYSDGHEHVYAAEVDRAGDLLFLERVGETTRTNLLRYLQDDALWWGA